VSGTCVIGLQWGDEAKGKLVDILTGNMDLVVRYQGGANAGHTVVIGSDVYKLHHIPSGIINAGVLNLISAGVVINPPTILQEIDSLVERGIDVASRMKISSRAHVVMPWHTLEDRMWNRLVSGEANIGTTLRGIGPCYADKIGRSFAVRMGDLIRDDFPERVRMICDVKRKVLSATGAEDIDSLDADSIIKEFSGYADRLREYVTDTNRIVLDAVQEEQNVLFEGAQGSLLDIDHGTFPFVTSSSASGTGISSGSGAPPNWLTRIIGVCKTYATRVGGGPFPTEQDNEQGQHIRDMGNEYGTTTGRDEIQVCTSYELDGKKVDWFPSHADDLKRLTPVYETLPGWKQDVTGARSLSDLPEKAIAYCKRLQELIGRPIEFISVGPDRAQTIHVEGNLAD